jgi:hypothetical protein
LAPANGYNTANGWLKLDGSGTAPDSTIPASIARDSEVSSAISTHAGATDPHGDRAYSVQRANHTGTQAQSTVTDLVTDLAAMVPKSLIDAKGDLIVGTANDTAARLGVGSNGQVLTADSGEASGVKWAAAAGGVTSVNGDTGTVVLDAADVGALSDSGGGKDAVSSLGALTGTVSIDLANGNSFYGTLSGNTTFTMTGFTTGRECQFVLSVTQDSTPRSVTWPAAVKWPFGSVPAISTMSGSRDLFVFRSRDGGTTVDGFQIGKGMA